MFCKILNTTFAPNISPKRSLGFKKQHLTRFIFYIPQKDQKTSCRLKVVPEVDAQANGVKRKRVLCYATDTKVGLQLLPLDGSQHRSVGVTGQPLGGGSVGGVSQVECSYDGRFVFAASSVNASVHMWKINYEWVHLFVGCFQKFFGR